MWLIILSVLAFFEIARAQDEFGNEIKIGDECDDLGTLQYVC